MVSPIFALPVKEPLHVRTLAINEVHTTTVL